MPYQTYLTKAELQFAIHREVLQCELNGHCDR